MPQRMRVWLFFLDGHYKIYQRSTLKQRNGSSTFEQLGRLIVCNGLKELYYSEIKVDAHYLSLHYLNVSHSVFCRSICSLPPPLNPRRPECKIHPEVQKHKPKTITIPASNYLLRSYFSLRCRHLFYFNKWGFICHHRQLWGTFTSLLTERKPLRQRYSYHWALNLALLDSQAARHFKCIQLNPDYPG